MKIVKTVVALTIGALFTVPALAQDADDMIQRNARQQERVEQGLRSGDLTVREAAQLEQRAGRIERYQSRALGDGTLSQEEARRIDRAQDRFGREITRQSNDPQTGDPQSASARRMTSDVARNADEQRRIAQGVRSGDLTNREAARLERGQSYVNRGQAQAGADGRIDRYEQRNVQQAQSHQSQNIWRERHDGQRGDQGGHATRYSQGGDRPGYSGQRPQGGDHSGYSGQRRGWDNSAQGYERPRAESRMAYNARANTQAPAGGHDRRR